MPTYSETRLNSLKARSLLAAHAIEAAVQAAKAASNPATPQKASREGGRRTPSAVVTAIAHHTATASELRATRPNVASSYASQKMRMAVTPPPPEDVPAVSAYVELVPTSRGRRSPGGGPTKRGTLPRAIEAQLAREGGSEAPLLKEVATSQAYGAPLVGKPVRREPEPEPTRES